MNTRYRYLIYGLVVESELRLSSVDEATDAHGAPAIEVTFAPAEYFAAIAPTSAPDPRDWVHHVVLADGRVYMRGGDVFEAVISTDGRDVLCRRLGDIDPRSFEANLMNFVISASLTLRGEEPLHSTVVEIDGCAVGLLGLSGAGKSTLAAFLITRGADLVTDDMLRVAFNDTSVNAYCGPYRLKLLDEPGRRYLPDAVVHGDFNPLSGKFMVQPREAVRAHRAPLPLAALFHIGHPDDLPAPTAVSARPLDGVELAKVIISSTMDTRYDVTDRLTRQMRFAARLAKALPIYALSYPRSFDVMDAVATEIRRKIGQ